MDASVFVTFSDEKVQMGETRSKDVNSSDDDSETKKNSYYIIGIVGAVVILVAFFILFASSKKLLCFRYFTNALYLIHFSSPKFNPSINWMKWLSLKCLIIVIFCRYLKGGENKGEDEKKEAELKSLNSCDAGQEKGEEKVETEETTPLASKTEKSQKFGDRFASFFRLNKTQSMAEEDVEAGKETEEVDTTKATEKKEEVADEEKPADNEETAPLAVEKSKSFGERFASFFRLRTTQSMTDDQDVEAGKDNAAVEEVDVATVETELKEVPVVGNGEEKGEKDVDEKEKSLIKTKKDIMSCFAGLCNKGGNVENEKKEEDETKAEAKTDENEKQVI